MTSAKSAWNWATLSLAAWKSVFAMSATATLIHCKALVRTSA